MASVASTCRLTAKWAGNQLRPYVLSRGFRSAPACLAAHTFAMPAMSPTMTEGNITKWEVKEGDSFSAGDLLLEIETDKAQMDVEAQDDGVMAKIIQDSGSKAVKVGSAIAVTADPGDDLSTLEMPADATASPASPQEDTKSGIDPAKSSPSAAEAPQTSKPSTPAKSETSGKADASEDAKAKAPVADPATKTAPESEGEPAKPIKQTHPLTPSVQHLLHEHGLSDAEADKIPASGPQGRVLKGDVLAYLGSIEAAYPSKQAARIVRLGHLDLSNVKPAPKLAKPSEGQASAAAPAPEAATPVPAPEPPVDISIPVSFAALLQVQARVEQTLGVYLPLSSFISRASKAANENLPRSKTVKPTQDELFNDVLGLNKVGSSSFSRGHYTPQVTALPVAHPGARPKHVVSRKQPDIIDFLSGKPASSRAGLKGRLTADPFISSAADEPAEVGVLSLSVPKADQKRARLFLERVKTVLESEPGRLVV